MMLKTLQGSEIPVASPHALMSESSICCRAEVSSENNFSLQYVDLSETRVHTVSMRHHAPARPYRIKSLLCKFTYYFWMVEVPLFFLPLLFRALQLKTSLHVHVHTYISLLP